MHCLQALFTVFVCLTSHHSPSPPHPSLDYPSQFLNGCRQSFSSVPDTHTWLKLCQPQADCNNCLSYLAKSTLINTVLGTTSCFAAAVQGWFIFCLWSSTNPRTSPAVLLPYHVLPVLFVFCFACLKGALCTCLNFIFLAFRQDPSFVKAAVNAEPF